MLQKNILTVAYNQFKKAYIYCCAFLHLKPSQYNSVNKQSKRLSRFSQRLDLLARKYQPSLVAEALVITKAEKQAILKRARALQSVERVVQVLHKINQSPRLRLFKYEKADKSSTPTYNNVVHEAAAALAAEEQKFITCLVRSTDHEADFFETSCNRFWDVKTGVSWSNTGEHIFKAQPFLASMKEDIARGEYIMLNITELKLRDLKTLIRQLPVQLTPTELEKVLIIHCTDATKSRWASGLHARTVLNSYLELLQSR